MTMRLSALTLLFSLWITGHVWGQDTQVVASVGSDSVGAQDQIQFSVTVSGKDSGDAEPPRLSSLKNFKIVSGPSVSTQFQWINGRTSSSKSFVYVLIPEKEGQFTIDPVEIQVADKTYKTQPIQVRVTSALRSPPPQRQRPLDPFDQFEPFAEEGDVRTTGLPSDAVIVKAELDRSTAYPGQQVTLAYQVYTQVGIRGFQLQESPPLKGFWVEDLEVEKEPRGTRQVVNGREYLAFTVKKQALFATTAGKLTIPSSIFAISADKGGNFLGVFGRTETLYRKTQELSLDVRMLPAAGRPSNFTNAVGSFSLSAEVDKTRAATGEAVALSIKLEGQGNLKMIPDIAFPSLPDFTIYSSKRADSIKPSAEDQIGGHKTWEYVIVPKVPGRQTVPSLSFSFFNAGENRYETVATRPISLDVARGADSTGISGLSGSDKQNLVRRGTDINFIKLSAGDLEKPGAPLYKSIWIYIISAIPLALNAGIILFQRQRSKLAGNEGSIRSRKARRNALGRLKFAEKQGRSDRRRFYDQAAAALSGYLSDRFSFTEIELTGDHLERNLSQFSIPCKTVEETRACLQACDFGRFVSATASQDGMRELATRIRKNIDALELGSSKATGTAQTKTKGRVLLLLCSLLLPALVTGQAAQSNRMLAELFERGNSEYQSGNYASAQQYYSRILNSGAESGFVYYNLGNAFFKQKKLGEAIYYWEKARQRLPADREIRENLEFANLLIVDRIDTPSDPLPMRILISPLGLLTIAQEGNLVLALFVVANLLFSASLLAKSSRRSSHALVASLVVGILFVVFGCSLSWKIYERQYRKKGVVTEQRVDVRSGPGGENIAVFTVHEGIRVRIHEFANGWYRVSLPNGWSGWLQQSELRIL